MRASNVQPTVIRNRHENYWMGGARVWDDDMYLCEHWSEVRRLNHDDALADARAMVRDLLDEESKS